jgi:TIR domain
VTVHVFFSYAHRDEVLRAELETHLAALKRRGDIIGWHDRAIGAGDEWRNQINDHLRAAHVILLLVSPDFLASDYCSDVELQLALERHARGEAVVIPVILRSVDWSITPFAKLQALPKDGKAVTSWPDRDAALMDVALGIRRVVETRFSQIPVPVAQSAAVLLPVTPAGPSPRVLDAALPSHIVQQRATELDVLIRRADSPGLRGLLEDDPTAEPRPADVQSRDFKMRFDVGADGKPEALHVTVLLTAPGFEPEHQQKTLAVPPDADSELLTFLLTPQQVGSLLVLVELQWEDAVCAPRRLRTQCVAHATEAPEAPIKRVVRLPIDLDLPEFSYTASTDAASVTSSAAKRAMPPTATTTRVRIDAAPAPYQPAPARSAAGRRTAWAVSATAAAGMLTLMLQQQVLVSSSEPDPAMVGARPDVEGPVVAMNPSAAAVPELNVPAPSAAAVEVAVAALITRDAKPLINSSVAVRVTTASGTQTMNARTDGSGRLTLPREVLKDAIALQVGSDVAHIPAGAAAQAGPLAFELKPKSPSVAVKNTQRPVAASVTATRAQPPPAKPVVRPAVEKRDLRNLLGE